MNSQDKKTEEQDNVYTQNVPNNSYADPNNQVTSLSNLMNNTNNSEYPINQIPSQSLQFPLNFHEPTIQTMSLFMNPNIDPNSNSGPTITTSNQDQRILHSDNLFDQKLQSDRRSRSRS